MRSLAVLIAFFTTALLTGCGKKTPTPGNPTAEGDDLQKVQGKWGLADVQLVGDEQIPKDMLAGITFSIEGDKITLDTGRGKPVSAMIKYDASKSPKEVDFNAIDDKGKPVTLPPTTFMAKMPPPAIQPPLKAIYKFEGEQLIVAMAAEPGQDRPTEFVAKPRAKGAVGPNADRGTALLTLKKLPADSKAIVPASVDKMTSMNNLKQVGLLIMNFDSAQGALPARALYTKDDKPGLSWRVHILPYLGDDEGDALYKQFKLDEPWDSPNNKPLIAKMPKVYAKPGGDAAKGETYIKVFHSPVGIFSGNIEYTIEGKKVKGNRTFWSVSSLTSSPRGTSNVIYCAEAGDPVIWTKPDDIDYDPMKPLPNLKGPYEGGFHVLMGDGKVLWVADGYKESALRASIEPNSSSTETLAK